MATSLPQAARYAVYLTPPADAQLTRAAEAWLGRSAFGRRISQADAPAEAQTHVPARYGFHGTMRAPFRLAEGASDGDIQAAFDAFSASEGPLRVRLNVNRLSHFLALTADDQTAIADAAMRALQHFEPLRAPLNAAERARRKADQLDPRGRALLDRWGYPHTEERFTFHMTLTGPVAAGAIDSVRQAADAHFAAAIADPVPLSFALFRESKPGDPFTVLAPQSAPRHAF